MMTDYQRTEWVFDNGDCNRCSHLVTEEATQTDPPCMSCSVLDNWSKHSDRCPRMDQFEAAFLGHLKALKAAEVIEDNWERFTALCTQIVEGTLVDDDIRAGEMIRQLYSVTAKEAAEQRML